MLSSNDPLLHFHLYRWLLSHGQQRHLLDINSDFLETFLRAHEELELLWQLYVRYVNISIFLEKRFAYASI